MAGTEACHYVGNQKQKVNVIGHHNIQIDMDTWVMLRNLVDYLFHHTTNIIQNHFSIDDLPKQRFTILGDDGYKICTWLRIIEIRYSQFFSVEQRVIWIHNVILPFCAELGASHINRSRQPFFRRVNPLWLTVV